MGVGLVLYLLLVSLILLRWLTVATTPATLGPAYWILMGATEPTLWSVVFALGMYSVATLSYGAVALLGFMAPLARFMLWVAVGAWTAVAAAFIIRLGGRTSQAEGESAAPPAAT